MNPQLRAYLVSIGMRSDATEVAAWQYYGGLEGDQRERAKVLKRGDGQRNEPGDSGNNNPSSNANGQVDGQRSDPPNNGTGDGNGQPNDGQRQAPPNTTPPANDPEAIRAAERQRIDQIRAAAGDDLSPEVVTRAINENWTVDQVREQALNVMRGARTNPVSQQPQDTQLNFGGQAPGGHVRGGLTAEAICMGLSLRAGWDLGEEDSRRYLRDPSSDRQWNQDIIERAADAQWQLRDVALVDICRMALQVENRPVPHGRSDAIRAAMSTASLTNIFSTNVNSRLLRGYIEAPDTTDWVAVTDVPDFKTNDRIRLEKGGGMKKLPRGKTAGHTTYSDEVESYKIHRYAEVFGVDEQDIIDDAVGALMTRPTEMGMEAARVRPDLVYSILKANANLQDGVALFAAGHANDAALPLNEANLEAVLSKLGLQQDNGVNLNLMARYLVCATELKFVAVRLLESVERRTRGNTDVDGIGTANPLRNEDIEVRSEGRLSNGVTDPDTGTVHTGSATEWYVSTDPRQGPTIEVAYLAGSGRQPRLRQSELIQGQYGTVWDINIDVGAKALNHRGMQRGNV